MRLTPGSCLPFSGSPAGWRAALGRGPTTARSRGHLDSEERNLLHSERPLGSGELHQRTFSLKDVLTFYPLSVASNSNSFPILGVYIYIYIYIYTSISIRPFYTQFFWSFIPQNFGNLHPNICGIHTVRTQGMENLIFLDSIPQIWGVVWAAKPFLIGKWTVNGPFSIAFCMFSRGYLMSSVG